MVLLMLNVLLMEVEAKVVLKVWWWPWWWWWSWWWWWGWWRLKWRWFLEVAVMVVVGDGNGGSGDGSSNCIEGTTIGVKTNCWHHHHFFILSIFLVEREKYEQRRQKSYRALLIELWDCYGQAKTQAARVYLVVVSGKQWRTDLIILSKNLALLDINLETPENAVVIWSRFWWNALTTFWFGDQHDKSTEVLSFPAHLLPWRLSSPGGRHLPSVWNKAHVQ